MKKLIIIFLVSFFGLFLSCNNHDTSDKIQFKSTGEILGLDEALCICCGDWKIKIDNDQNDYQFITLPQNSNIDLQNAQLPISVKLNWRLDENSTCANHIIVEQIDLN